MASRSRRKRCAGSRRSRAPPETPETGRRRPERRPRRSDQGRFDRRRAHRGSADARSRADAARGHRPSRAQVVVLRFFSGLSSLKSPNIWGSPCERSKRLDPRARLAQARAVSTRRVTGRSKDRSFSYTNLVKGNHLHLNSAACLGATPPCSGRAGQQGVSAPPLLPAGFFGSAGNQSRPLTNAHRVRDQEGVVENPFVHVELNTTDVEKAKRFTGSSSTGSWKTSRWVPAEATR